MADASEDDRRAESNACEREDAAPKREWQRPTICKLPTDRAELTLSDSLTDGILFS